jgi:hypothetical protein
VVIVVVDVAVVVDRSLVFAVKVDEWSVAGVQVDCPAL